MGGHLWSSGRHPCCRLFVPTLAKRNTSPGAAGHSFSSSFLAHYWGNVFLCGWTAISLAGVALGSAAVKEA